MTEEMILRGRANEFTALARALCLGSTMTEAKMMMGSRLSPRCNEILAKADVGQIAAPGGSPATWGSALAEYEQIAGAFLESLSSISVFDAAVDDMRQIPVRGRMPIVDAQIGAFIVSEAGVKAVSEISFDGRTLDELKAVALIFASKELLRLGGATAASLFNVELPKAVTKATDEKFLSDLIAATTPVASTGDPADDFAALLGAIVSGADARIFVAVTPAVAKQLATSSSVLMPTSDMSPNGGTVAGVRVIATDALDDGEMIGFDARQLAGNRGMVGISSAHHATIDINGGENPTFSLFQKNCRALRAERTFAYEVLRAAAVASLSGVNYSGVSP